MCQPSSPAGSSHSGAGGWRGGLEGRWKGKGCKEEVSPCVPKSLTASLLVAAVTGTPQQQGGETSFKHSSLGIVVGPRLPGKKKIFLLLLLH